MASAMKSKDNKKLKAKEFMKKLKSMLPNKNKRSGKLDTLSTLEQLVDSMREMNEEKKRGSEFKAPPPHCGSYITSDTDKFQQNDMYINVSTKNHVVLASSGTLMEFLGYPVDWWQGRLLKDFIHKKDINMVNSCLAISTFDEQADTHTSDSTPNASAKDKQESAKFFFVRIRRFRKLAAGFSLQNVVSYCPFTMTISHHGESTESVEGSSQYSQSQGQGPSPAGATSAPGRKGITIHCHPLVSPYEDGLLPVPEERHFSLRHSLHCNYTYVHPNAVKLLGFLPQDFTSMSIFDLYHPDDYDQLLDIHKKITQSNGQPFKSSNMRLKTRNGCYIQVVTDWSSFVNPWSKGIEFIIGQHEVITGPSKPDLFEDITTNYKVDTTQEMTQIKEEILDVLRKPIQGVFKEPIPVSCGSETVMEQIASPTQTVVPASPPTHVQMTTDPAVASGSAEKTAVKLTEITASESKSTMIDDKSISTIYNQINYSHNIKRFLTSHPKSFSNVSDEENRKTSKDYREDEAMNEDEEMPLEIPVVKPPSCGSSTQVHVSDQGPGEEMQSPLTFGDDAMPRQATADNRQFLSEETLKKHTKMQERLYLQRISEDQPTLLNVKRIKFLLQSFRNFPHHQKTKRPHDASEEVKPAKQPCIKGGIFRSSSNIFMQNFPAVTSADATPVTTATVTTNSNPSYSQTKLVGQTGAVDPSSLQQQSQQAQHQPGAAGPAMVAGSLAGSMAGSMAAGGIQGGLQAGLHSFQPLTAIYHHPTGNQQPGIMMSHHQPIALRHQGPIQLMPQGASLPLSCLPSGLGPFVPNLRVADSEDRDQQDIQWPYYPQTGQTGYTLLPQVMGGFYHPLVQPVQMQVVSGVATPVPHPDYRSAGTDSLAGAGEPAGCSVTQEDKSSTKMSVDRRPRGAAEYDPHSSSNDETGSSILYLLEADSSTLEDSDNKHSSRSGMPAQRQQTQKKRPNEPAWLQGVNWNSDVKMRYKMPQQKLHNVLKMDDKMIKSLGASSQTPVDQIQACLAELLGDVNEAQDHTVYDEECDYLFYPGDEPLDDDDRFDEDHFEEAIISMESGMDIIDDSGGGDGGGGGGRGAVAGGEDKSKPLAAEEPVDPAVLWTLGPTQDEGSGSYVPDASSPQSGEGNMGDNFTADDLHHQAAEEDKMAAVAGGSGAVELPQSPTKKAHKRRAAREISPNPSTSSNKTTDDGSEVVPMQTACVGVPDDVAEQNGSEQNGSIEGSKPQDSCSKDGSSNGDGEMDSQSNCSKESSELTPSDNRSNEENGSSLKESDASMKHMKDVSSVTSSSTGHESPDHLRDSEVATGGVLPHISIGELFKKLFVPLRVRIKERVDAPGGGPPHWLMEAHLSQNVAMTYKLPSLDLEDTLTKDNTNITHLIQSPIVKQQLLQLLSDVEVKTSSAFYSSIAPAYVAASPASTSLNTSSVSVSSASAAGAVSNVLNTAACQLMTDESGSENSVSKSDNSGTKSSSNSDAAKCLLTNDSTTLSKKGKDKPSTSKSSDTNSDPVASGSLSGDSGQSLTKTKSMSGKDKVSKSSDTNSDPVAYGSLSGDSGRRSRSAGRSSSLNDRDAAQTDSCLSEYLTESGTAVGKSLEDIIMEKVFLSQETSDMKNSTFNYSLSE